MHIDYLWNWYMVYFSMSSQCKKLNIITEIRYESQILEDWFWAFAYGLIDMMNLHLHDCWIFFIDLSLKARQRGHNYYHSEFLFILIGSAYSLNYGLRNCVFNRNKKLILYVDELLGIKYKFYIGFENRTLLFSLI